jgi:hypothetical protein
MSPLSRLDVEALAETTNGLCVSIYMPTEQAGPDVQQNTIRLKNLLDQAEERLTQMGMRSPDARELLKPVRDLLPRSLFWQYQRAGLALLVSKEGLLTYQLSQSPTEQLVVGERFYIKPLLPLLSGDGQFLILAISQNQLRLLEATRESVSEVNLENVPTSLAEALRFDDPEKQLQWHTSTDTFAARGRGAMYHGHGTATADDPKDYILRYFQQVDRGLREYLGGRETRLLLAGVDYLLPIYHQANDYPHLMEEGITGSPDELSVKELHRKAWAIMAPHFERERQEWASRYLESAGRGDGLALERLEEIVPAAADGRIDTLFVALESERWGRFDAAQRQIELHEDQQQGDQELLDLAAVLALLSSGRVYAVPADHVPGGGVAAAVLRY